MSADSADPKSSPSLKEVDPEVDVLLGDGFSIVDDVSAKEDDSTAAGNKEEDAKPSQKKDGAEPSKVDGGVDKKADASAKKKDGAKKEEESSAEDKGEKNTPKAAANKTKSATASATNGTPAQKSDVSSEKASESKDASSSITESKEDSLIITAEEDIDVAENKDSGDSKKDKKSSLANGDSSRAKAKTAPSMWVSNIARRVKATDLKRIFSKHGRVITAKIVTNGKSYFGYVCMDSNKSVENCIKHLNNIKLADKKISISSERPDAPKRSKPSEKKSTSSSVKKDDKSESANDTKDKSKKEEANEKKTDGDKEASKKKEDDSAKSSDKKRRPIKERLEIPKKDETVALRKEIKLLRGENDNLRRRMSDVSSRSRTDLFRSRRFERLLKDAEDKLREERKKFDKEREVLLKKNRNEQSKLDAERDILEKERMDLKRRRDDLEHEMRKFAEMQRSVVERSHRPSRKSRSPSPPPRGGGNAKRFKSSDLKHESKKARWSGDRTRTPPPPPKLSAPSEPRSKREPDHFYEDRTFRREVTVYVPPGEYPGSREGRHGRGGMPPETKSAVVVPSRSAAWSSSSNNIASSQWRPGSSDLPSQYSEGRYRDQPYRSSAGYPDPPREEMRGGYPEYRRPTHYEAPARKY